MKSQFVEAVAANDIRASVWKNALERHAGNITRASNEFGFSKQRGFALTKKHSLVELAIQLRLASGQKTTGRPKR